MTALETPAKSGHVLVVNNVNIRCFDRRDHMVSYLNAMRLFITHDHHIMNNILACQGGMHVI